LGIKSEHTKADGKHKTFDMCDENLKGGTEQELRQTKNVCHSSRLVRLSVTTAGESPMSNWGAFPGLRKAGEERGTGGGILKNLKALSF